MHRGFPRWQAARRKRDREKSTESREKGPGAWPVRWQLFPVPTSNERKALWFLAVIAVSGSGVRLWRAQVPEVPAADSAALAYQIARVDSARARADGRKSSRSGATKAPASPVTTPVDLDRASAVELEALPGIGPALAARIVAHRDSAGPFGHLAALCAVRGVGPVLVERLRPLVTFSVPRSPVSDACDGASKGPRKRRSTQGRQSR